ncbi:MAG: DUF1223 domain-containing protein [Ferrovibrionaceae bacterium]
MRSTLSAFVALAALLCAVPGTGLRAGSPEEGAAQGPVVVELFTSEGCASCPSADAVLADLARRPDVIAMSLHVDYWDHLGWKDTLGLPGHTRRQKAYQKTMGTGYLYTPQAVIQGTSQTVGSDRPAIERLIAKAATLPHLRLALRDTPDGRVLDIGEGPYQGMPATVWLCPLQARADVAIERGENAGKTLTYEWVVRGWTKLGQWSGEALTVALPDDLPRPAVLLVQAGYNGHGGAILGAMKVE